MKIIDVKGKPEEMGLAIGREARLLIQKQVRLYKENWKLLTHVSWEKSLQMTKPFEAVAGKTLPETFAELAGIAAGANVSARELFLINAFEEVDALTDLERKHKGKCTSIAMTGAHMKDGRPRIAHNEDWMWFDTDLVYVVRAKPEGAPAFLSVTYGGLLANNGFNECGVAQVCDSLAATDERLGVPRLFVARQVLAAKSVNAAMATIKKFSRSGGYNHLLMDGRGHAVNFETSATQSAMIPVQDFSVHTNFYQDPKLAKSELHTTTYSRYRYFRAKELLKVATTKSAGCTQDDLFGVLADHQNYPESVCRHRSDLPEDNDQTIVSYLMDPARRIMHIRGGNPCGHTTRKKVPASVYFLDEHQELWQ